MVDKREINKWVKDGIITKAQAKKMLENPLEKKKETRYDNSTTIEAEETKSNKFIAIVGIIGAVLIFIGFAWMIARNWHQIPNLVKVLILIGATLGAFFGGVFARDKNHEGIGRSLITLGGLLFFLSLILISQTYNLATEPQHYAWIFLFSWVIILLTAYFLDSKENVVVSMIFFFIWVVIQYISSTHYFDIDEGVIFGFIFIALSVGFLLFGLSSLHNSLKHKFTNLYRFWTVFYFMVIFYIMSFQIFIPFISEYYYDLEFLSGFFIIFVLLCLIGGGIGIYYAIRKEVLSFKTLGVFLGICAVIIILILATKLGEGTVGACYPKSCHDFKNEKTCNSFKGESECIWMDDEYCTYLSCSNFRTEESCNSYSGKIKCNWTTMYNREQCFEVSCYNLKTEESCNSADPKLFCSWDEGWCTSNKPQVERENYYETCGAYDNKKEECLEQDYCRWYTNHSIFNNNISGIFWFIWILNNIAFIGFIILTIWYGQMVGSTKIVNLALVAFSLEVISRYIGFWLQFKGYLAFSILAILGGGLLIGGSLFLPKWRRKILDKTERQKGGKR